MEKFDEKLDKTLNTWGAPKEVLAEIVDSYINNELGSGGSSGESSDSSTSTSCDCAETVSALQTQVDELTATIEENTKKLNLLLNKLYDNAAIYETPYEQIDPSILFRTYDFIEKDVNFTFTTSKSSLPYFLYCLDCEETTIKVYYKVTAAAEGTGSIALYINGTRYDETQTFEVVAGEQTLEFTFTVPLLETGNQIDTTLYTDKSNQLIVSKIKYEAFNCTNPTFVKYLTDYNVDYYGGLYYITNCSGKTAKYAIVDPATLNTVNDIVWTDTGIDAFIYRFNTNAIYSGDVYKHDVISYFYLTRDNVLTCVDNKYGKTYTNTAVLMADAGTPYTSKTTVPMTYMYGRVTYAQVLNHTSSKTQSLSYIDRASLYAAAFAPKYFYKETTSLQEPYCYVLQNNKNEIVTSFKGALANIGYGTYMTSYITSKKPYITDIYVKVHDYVVKHTVTYNVTGSTGQYVGTTSEVVGKYDYYFRGADEDYFTVTNGVLNYYKKDFTETSETTTTE